MFHFELVKVDPDDHTRSVFRAILLILSLRECSRVICHAAGRNLRKSPICFRYIFSGTGVAEFAFFFFWSLARRRAFLLHGKRHFATLIFL